MICLAFGAKCGAIARATTRPPVPSAASACAVPADASSRSSMSDASASEPMPNPACRKKCRRVRSRSVSVSVRSFGHGRYPSPSPAPAARQARAPSAYFVTASSRFNSALATMVHAARSRAGLPDRRLATAAGGTCATGMRSCGAAPASALEVRQLLPVRGDDAIDLRARSACERSRGGTRAWRAFARSGSALTHHPIRERACRFEERLVVQHRQRLQRRVRPHAAHRAELAAGGVERQRGSGTARCGG